MTAESLSRRRFVATLAAGSACALMPALPATAIDPIQRTGKQTLKLALAAYSLRQFFGKKPDEPGAIEMPGFIDYCSKLGLDGAELTQYFFPKDTTRDYINGLKRRAHLAGIDISGGAIGNNFTIDPGPKLDQQMAHTKTWIDHYADLGAPVIRVFAGNPPAGVSEDEAIKRAVPALEAACEAAGRRGVMLAIENHDFATKVDRLLQIVKAVKSPWFGVNFDSGNLNHSTDPYADMARIAPYAVNAQLKVDIRAAGGAQPADMSRVVKVLRDAGYSGYIVLEYEAKEDPYQAIPRHLDELRTIIG
jgi:sugar phosphate isomerase/epimerase